MLEKILKFIGVKKYNDFMAKLFGFLMFATVLFIIGLFLAFLVGDGRSSNLASPLVFAVLLCFPPLFFSYLVNSKMKAVKDDNGKVKWFMISFICLGIITLCMYINWLNDTIWWALHKIPNYDAVKKAYPQVFAPALKTICLVGPFVFIFYIIDFLTLILREEDYIKGIAGFCGLSIGSSKNDTGPFSCENIICRDPHTAAPVIVPEKKRMEATLVQGATGTGKTAAVLLPMSARDVEKKYFFREYSKKLGYSLLKRGVAYIEGPYTNEYLNRNFRLDFLKPKKGAEKEFLETLDKIILYQDSSTGEITYRNVGVTVVENDGNYVSNFIKVAHNFDFDVCTIDPIAPETTLSINPFAIKDPAKVASIIADVLKSMQQSEGGKEETFFAQVTLDAFQNLAILLKEMYPLLNNGVLPSLEDMLELLYNFDKVEDLVEEMKKIPELEQKYALLISYFEKNFYKPSLNINGYEIPGTRGSGRKDTERFLYGAITQLNNLLRHPGLKKALCGKDNVLNFDEALRNGSLITACSRKGELGIIQSKAFGMFFILQFQDAVLRRVGNEDSRIPHFLYIDEFPEYLNKEMDVMFTLFRKYRCGVTIALQNLSQLEKSNSSYYRQTVLANTKTQIVFGDTVPEDSEYWNKAFGQEKKVDKDSSFDPSTGDVKKKQTIKVKDKERFKIHKIQENKFGAVYYKTKNAKGNSVFGEGKVSFLEDNYKVKHPAYMYNFEKFMIVKPVDSDYTGISNNGNVDTENTAIIEDDDDLIMGTYSGKKKTSNNFNNYNSGANNSPIIENNEPEDINVADDPIDERLEDSTPDVINEIKEPAHIQQFDIDFLNEDDDFDIVIDTGTDKPADKRD